MKKYIIAALVALAVFLAPYKMVFAKPPTVVVVLDTGLDLKDPRFAKVLCKTGHKDFTGRGIKDVEGHGTFVAGLIKEGAMDANYCMVIVKYVTPGKLNVPAYRAALRYVFNVIKPQIINVSGGGDYDPLEDDLVRTHQKVIIVAATGNNGMDLRKEGFFPASLGYPNVIPVGSVKANGERAPSSNYGINGMQWELGVHLMSTVPGGITGYRSGTSMAAAVHTGKLLREGPYAGN